MLRNYVIMQPEASVSWTLFPLRSVAWRALADMHLVLLIQELINLRRSSNLECTITPVRFVPRLGTAHSLVS
jgi:hypothetical protein